MTYNPQHHHRRSIRLKGYDYSQEGLYYITICVQNRECLFGDITVGAYPCGRLNPNNQSHEHAPTVQLNDAGIMVEKQWLALTDRFPNVQLHEYVIMPNHFHGILEIVPDVGAYVGVGVVGANVGAYVGAIPCGRPLDGGDGRPIMNNENQLNNDRPLNGRPCIGQPQGHAPTGAKRKTVGDMMDAFKSITTVEYIRGVKNMDWPSFNGKLWQRDYYEHIIRDYDSFVRISEYIRDNPGKWNDD